jgi:hypothetical protein
MNEMTVKFGDSRKIGWRASTSLVDADVVLKVENSAGAPIDTTDDILIPDPPSGIVFWQLDGTLPVGSYLVELEITRDGETMHAPTKGQRVLTVEEALG